MPRRCTVCQHPARPAIDQALVTGVPNRRVATDHQLTEAAVRRHRDSHLPATLAQAGAAQEATRADNLLHQVEKLKAKAISLLLKAEAAGDYRTALAGIREARACLELLLEVEGEINRQPVVNLLVSPEWLQTRATIIRALDAYPEARQAVTVALSATGSHA